MVSDHEFYLCNFVFSSVATLLQIDVKSCLVLLSVYWKSKYIYIHVIEFVTFLVPVISLQFDRIKCWIIHFINVVSIKPSASQFAIDCVRHNVCCQFLSTFCILTFWLIYPSHWRHCLVYGKTCLGKTWKTLLHEFFLHLSCCSSAIQLQETHCSSLTRKWFSSFPDKLQHLRELYMSAG